MSSIHSGLGMRGRFRVKGPRQVDRDDRLHVLAWKVKTFLLCGWREVPLRLFLFLLPVIRACVPGLTVMVGRTYLRKWDSRRQRWVDYGLAGVHLITTAGKNAVASAFNSVMEPETFNYHGYGTGTTAAAVGDTALVTEMSTAYNPNSTRVTGTQSNSTNTYTTQATVTPDAATAVTEWGLFTQAATGGGTLLDRQVFSAINLNGTGDSLQTTYVLTIS